jgi:GNAT superfamily N-acetyltransferase
MQPRIGCYNLPMEAEIRRAGENDAAALARICYMAGKSHSERSIYDLLFPGPYGDTPERLSLMEKALATRHVCWLHCSKFIVAEVAGEVAVGLSGFSEAEANNSDFGESFTELGWKGPDFAAMAERLSPLFKVDPPKADGVWVVENVATFPRFRGRGLINLLLERVLQEGRDRGHNRAQINIMTGNVPAQRAYEKVGFRVDRDYGDPSFEDFFDSPGMTRMLLEL